MTKECDDTFVVIDTIRNDVSSKTRGVDAFSLAWIRAERQIRRLLTSLVFQSSSFDQADVPQLMEALAKSRPYIYFRHFKASFQELVAVQIANLVTDYARLDGRMDEAWKYRQKIFHGQLTNDRLTTGDLLALEDDIRIWCKNLADGAQARFGYDGFSGKSSFEKRGRADIVALVDAKIKSVAEYQAFLKALARA